MFCAKKSCNLMGNQQSISTCSAVLFGMISGAAVATTVFIIKKMKEKKMSLKNALKDCCGCDETDNTYENFCECNGDPNDHERARNGFDCHAEEYDTDILHSHGCLGYQHDQYGGFANSNGDRPNDLSNPEIENQKGIPEGNTSPYWAKNAQGKSNPQPENKVNEVKKKS